MKSICEADIARIAGRFGRRLIVTDRFAVAITTPLRRAACAAGRSIRPANANAFERTDLAKNNSWRNELYPDAASYTDVYRRDGLLDHQCILAHCIHMRPEEWQMLGIDRFGDRALSDVEFDAGIGTDAVGSCA